MSFILFVSSLFIDIVAFRRPGLSCYVCYGMGSDRLDMNWTVRSIYWQERNDSRVHAVEVEIDSYHSAVASHSRYVRRSPYIVRIYRWYDRTRMPYQTCF